MGLFFLALEGPGANLPLFGLAVGIRGLVEKHALRKAESCFLGPTKSVSWEQFYQTTRQVLGRPVCDRGAIPRTLVQSNVVRSRLIILINEEINETNWMVSNSAKLDRRTKQHTQFGVCASNGSRDMAQTKSWRKNRKKKKINNKANWMVSNSAKLDSRTKQHIQSGVSTSDGSRDMARTKSWRKKRKKIKKKKTKRIGW